MKITLTKKFHFSASYAISPDRVIGHNYILGVTTEGVDEAAEMLLEKKIHEALIQKIDSQDLGMHVDFLKNIKITDTNLLRVFWEIIRVEIHPIELSVLSLQRDEHTEVFISRSD